MSDQLNNGNGNGRPREPREPALRHPWRKHAPGIWLIPAVAALAPKDKWRLLFLMDIASQSPRRWYITDDDETLAANLEMSVTAWLRWAAKRMEGRLLFALDDGSWLLSPRLFAYEDDYPQVPSVAESIESLGTHAAQVGPPAAITATVSEDAERQILRRAFQRFVEWMPGAGYTVPVKDSQFAALRKNHREHFLPHFRSTGERLLPESDWHTLAAAVQPEPLADPSPAPSAGPPVTSAVTPLNAFFRDTLEADFVTPGVTSQAKETEEEESREGESHNNTPQKPPFTRDVTPKTSVTETVVTHTDVTRQEGRDERDAREEGEETPVVVVVEAPVVEETAPQSEPPSELLEEIVEKYGISRSVAVLWIEKHPEEHLRDCCWWISLEYPGTEREHTGLLVRYVSGEYARRAAVNRELARLETERREAERKARILETDQSRQQAIANRRTERESYLESLTEAQQTALRERAISVYREKHPAVWQMCGGDTNRPMMAGGLTATIERLIDEELAKTRQHHPRR